MKLSKLVRATYNRAKRLAVLRESTAPLTGPYYWIPTPNGWQIASFPDQEYGDLIHERAWRRYVIHILQDYWALTGAEVRQISETCYGLPRGRVSDSLGSDNISYYVHCADDAPVPRTEAFRMVIREMNLVSLRAAGKVRMLKSNHEQQLPQHKIVVQMVLDDAKQRFAQKP